MRKVIALGNKKVAVCLVQVRSFVTPSNTMEHVLTHYGEILPGGGRGEGRRVCRNFAAECTREAEVDVAKRYLALVRVDGLKHTLSHRYTERMDVPTYHARRLLNRGKVVISFTCVI